MVNQAFSVICVVVAILHEATSSFKCENSPVTNRTVKISINRKRNFNGEWVTALSAQADCEKSSNDTIFDLKHNIVDCDDKRVIYIQGEIRDISVGVPEDRLYFYSNGGKNAAVIGNGRTVQKINLDDPHNSVVFTNRPLKNNEIFEVRLDTKNTKFSHSLGIGVTTNSPVGFDFPPQMWLKPNAWIMHNNEVYSNATAILKNYGRTLNELKVGERVGVMRSEHNVLHFFINGVDQGPAVSNMPQPVYGVFELWNNAVKATIVDVPSS